MVALSILKSPPVTPIRNLPIWPFEAFTRIFPVVPFVPAGFLPNSAQPAAVAADGGRIDAAMTPVAIKKARLFISMVLLLLHHLQFARLETWPSTRSRT
jgi:hypothetical protein